jgi:NAD(P)-dependent dehydrogenase (short-subunit alcohol dehydrogenase family)
MTAPAFNLTGRTALITGASSGLGAHFARTLAAAGARVVLAARRTDRLAALQAELTEAGAQAISVAMDVADEASTIAAYDTAAAAFGEIDTVVANAGTNAEGPVVDLTAQAFDDLMAVNLRGVFLTVREGGKRMMAAGSRERQHGRIIIISSITAHAIEPGLAAYSASKAAVLQFGRVLARDWIRQGINVNMICPGYIRTEINADWFDTEAGARQIAKFPRRRLMLESDLDGPLLFLASDASRAVTGTALTIDDGQSL